MRLGGCDVFASEIHHQTPVLKKVGQKEIRLFSLFIHIPPAQKSINLSSTCQELLVTRVPIAETLSSWSFLLMRI